MDSICVETMQPLDPRFACRDKPWEKAGPESGQALRQDFEASGEPSFARMTGEELAMLSDSGAGSGNDIITYPFLISRLVGEKPYEGLTFLACPSFDRECKNPLDKATSDARGRFSMKLPVGYRGHIQAIPPKKDPSLVPVEAYVFPPPSRDPKVPKRPGLVTTTLEVIQGLAALAKVKVVPGAGHLIFTAIDCKGEALEQVQVQISESTSDAWQVYVGAGGQPDPTLKATGPSGRGAILNIPAGYLTVTGIHAEHGKIFEQSVVVSPNKLTSVPIVPSPIQ